MATVHPSRMALVPQDPPKDVYSQSRDRRRSPSPRPSRRRSPSPPRERDKDVDRYGRREPARNRDERREREGEPSKRNRARADDYFDEAGGGGQEPRKRSRSRSADRERDHEREERRERERPRRRSPEYGEYRRLSPPRESAPAPWRQQENMYPRGREVGRFAGGGNDFMESRRQQRENSTFSIWPPSPKAPTRDLSGERDSKHRKKSHKRRYDSDSDTDTDSEEERRRKRKERKKSRKEKKDKERDRERERSRERRKHRSRSRRYSDEEDSEDERELRRRKDHRRSATRTRSPEQGPPTTEAEDEWVEKSGSTGLLAPAQSSASSPKPSSIQPPATNSLQQPTAAEDDDEDDEVGPKLPQTAKSSRSKVDERQYGGALLRGEGSAMAAFLKDGTDVRIPRRGEIGLQSDEIASFESVGYVMSGSRHRRMNAVRMRKENQVISAEEKRGILKLQQEERERREAILREEFQQLVSDKLKSQGGPAK